jgi:hypothetical protein
MAYMTHILNLTREDPVIHLKAYSGAQIIGTEGTQVVCEIHAPQLATLVEDDGHVFVTVNSSCQLTVPLASSIEIEKGMGSIKITNIHNEIKIEKVLGNLVLNDIEKAIIEKVGGNFSVHNAQGEIVVDKVAGSLTVDDVGTFHCEKVGGSCRVKAVHGDFSLEKAGGSFKGQAIEGLTVVAKLGGSFTASELHMQGIVKVGGSIKLYNSHFEEDLSLHAGGDIEVMINEMQENLSIACRSGARDIAIKVRDDDIKIEDYSYEYQIGEDNNKLSLAAGGAIRLIDHLEESQDVVGDLSDRLDFEESPLSEMIQERIQSATRRAEAKIKAAEIRLEQMQSQVSKRRGFDVDVHIPDFDFDYEMPPHVTYSKHVPPVTKPVGKKGASDEERLMILKMLQDNKITVDEAETLFQALED